MHYKKDPGKDKISKILYLNLLTELEDDNETFKKVYEFLYKSLPKKIREKQPFYIKPLDRNVIFEEFRINSFLLNPDSYRSLYSIRKLLSNLDLEQIKKLMKVKNLELIGIDESKVEVPLEGSIFTYLKSTALRMFKDGNGHKVELIGPVVQEIKLNYVYSEKKDKEIQFFEYLRNLFIVLLAIKNSLANSRKPLIFLHGPLVRAIGGFTDLFFKYRDLKEVLSINLENQEDINTSVLNKINGEKLLEELHNFEKNNIWNENNLGKLKGLIFNESKEEYWKKNWKEANPWDFDSSLNIDREKNFTSRKYAGFIVYLFLLRKIYDLAKEKNIVIISVVEDVSKSTEISKYLMPNLFFDDSDNFYFPFDDEFTNFLKNKFNIDFKIDTTLPDYKEKIYKNSYSLCKKIFISDSVLFTNILNEAEYTSPIPTFRYMIRKFFQENWGHTEYGIDNDFEIFLNELFPYPDYKILVSYLRTTPFREPIRIEFFDAYNSEDISYKDIIGVTYFLSLFYHQYGLPVILKYVDALARTPKTLVERIVKSEVERILKEGDFDTESILRIFNELSRNFFRR